MPRKKAFIPEFESSDDLLGLVCTVQDYVAIDCTCDNWFFFPSLECVVAAVPCILHDTDTNILSVYKRTYNDLYFPHKGFLNYFGTCIIHDGSVITVSTEEIGLEMLKEA